jgi:hypothetical protein
MIQLALPPDIEARIKGEASKQGLLPEAFIQKLIIERFPPADSNASLSNLFAEWAAEDFTDDPAEIAKRNEEVEEFKEAMNRNRLDMEGPDARKPFP